MISRTQYLCVLSVTAKGTPRLELSKFTYRSQRVHANKTSVHAALPDRKRCLHRQGNVDAARPGLGRKMSSSANISRSHRPENPTSSRPLVLRALALAVALSGFGYSYYFRYVERVPETGRWRKVKVRPEVEVQLGEDAYGSIVSRYQGRILSEEHPTTRRIHEIVSVILEVNGLGTVEGSTPPDRDYAESHLPGAENKSRRWRLAVIDNDRMINSTASSGGIIVFTGMLSFCKDDDEVAAVLGHEIAHVVTRHLAEQHTIARDSILNPFSRLVFSNGNPQGKLEKVLAENRHLQELEADAIGLRLTSKACFNPQAAISVNERLSVLENSLRQTHGVKAISTHVTSEERIRHLSQLLPEAKKIVEENPQCAQLSRRARTMD